MNEWEVDEEEEARRRNCQGQQMGPDPKLGSPNACLEVVFTELPSSQEKERNMISLRE